MRSNYDSLMRSRAAVLLILGALTLLFAAGCGSADRGESGAAPDLAPALAHYEAIRGLLAADRMDGVPEAAQALSASLNDVRQGEPAPDSALAARLDAAARSAETLSKTSELAQARKLFSPLSRDLVGLLQADPGARDDLHVFECPMVTDRFNKWIQPSAELQNPYMGTKMLKCGSEVSWSSVPVTSSVSEGSRSGSPSADRAPLRAPSGDGDPVPLPTETGTHPAHNAQAHVHSNNDNDIAYYTCPMHPSVKQHTEGTCPLCGMDLVPVTKQEVQTGVVIVDGARRQQIGVRLAEVERLPLVVDVRAVGRVAYDETRLSDVTPRVGGWIGDLHADATGMPVRRGEPLFTLYSPELFSAQEEYLAALAARKKAQESSAPDRADYLVDAARRRLELWDLTADQIDGIAERGKPVDYIPILSPVSGYVVEKNVVEGAAIKPGERLFRIAALDRVWIEAELYESQLSLARVGIPVKVTLPYRPGETASGRVSFVYPYLDNGTRTARARIELDNPDLALKPDMYANVEFVTEREPRLSVPESAVLYAGDRRAVFVQVGPDRFQPRIIQTGMTGEDRVEVLSGLTEGETVVASGNFLIAAESRLKTSMERWQ